MNLAAKTNMPGERDSALARAASIKDKYDLSDIQEEPVSPVWFAAWANVDTGKFDARQAFYAQQVDQSKRTIAEQWIADHIARMDMHKATASAKEN
jgi:hypothetical protein